MTVEEALEIVQSVLEQGRLSKVQEIVFRQSWEARSYQEMATSSGYEVGYVTDVGSKLWQLLSKAFSKKVTKHNFQGVLRQHLSRHTIEQRRSKFAEEKNTVLRYQDWGEAVDVSVFYGRAAELDTLKQWLVQDHCRLVTLFGMGGVGKTTLAVRAVEQMQDEFKFLVWRSLRNAPPITDLIAELIFFFSQQQEVNLPETVEGRISRLMEYLRSSRCLLVFDNSESILRSGERAGRYLPGYEGYGQLLRRVADERHQSCLVLTSREKPIGLMAKEGGTLPVRSLQITGLQQAEAQKILKAKGLVAAEDESRRLIERYTGNPLVLKIAATTIQSLFHGNVSKFLEQGTIVVGDIWELLDQQFNRLSALEKQLMYWLASAEEYVTLPELLESIVPTISYRELLGALESLQQRSLIERRSTCFIQQSVIMEYMSERGLVRLIKEKV